MATDDARRSVDMTHSVIGIDPGLSGALALYAGGAHVTVEDLPVWYAPRGKKTARKVDVLGLQRLINQWRDTVSIDQVFIEAVHTMPKQGIVSAGQFMEAFGAIQACVLCAGLPIVLVDPATWKTATGLGRDKKLALRRAAMTFPHSAASFARAMDHNRAEAALLAAYGYNYVKGVANAITT